MPAPSPTRLLALALLLALPGCDSNSRASRSAHDRGVESMEMEEYDEAVEAFTEAIEHDPNRGETFDSRARCYEELKQYDEAAQDLGKAIRLTVDDEDSKVELRFRRGRAYYRSGSSTDAIRDFDKVLFVEPHHALALLFRGYACQSLGWNKDALATLDKAAQTSAANEADLFLTRGNAHEALGDHAKAIKDYTRAIRIEGDQRWYYIRRADLYRRLGDDEKALDDYTSAIEVSSDDYAHGFFRRAQLHEAFGRFRAAVSDMRRAIKIEPDAYQYRNVLAGWYRDRGERQSVIDVYTNAIETDKENSDWYERRAEAHLQAGEYDRALEDSRQALEIEPESVGALSLIGNVHKELRQWPEALVAYEAALAIDEYDAPAQAGRAIALFELGRRDEARAACEAVIADDVWRTTPDALFWRRSELLTTAHWILARIEADEDNAPAARAELSRAQYHAADSASLLNEAAVIQDQLDNPAAAAMDRFRAIRLQGLTSPRDDWEE